MHDFSANTEVSVTPVALAAALTPRIGVIGAANGMFISANSSNTALTITQTGAGNAFLVEDSTSPDATPFVVKADGKVGVGLTAPTNLFHVSGSAIGDGITLENTDSGATAGPRLVLYRNSANAAVSDALGVLYFMGNSTTTNGAIYATIGGFIDDNVSGTENGRLTFTTMRDGVGTTAMTIGSNGRVRIGGSSVEPGNAVFIVDRPINFNASGNFGILLSSAVQSDVVSVPATGFLSNVGTQAAAFTLTNLNHYAAQQGTLGAGSAITAQSGFLASQNLIGATTNYGFRSLNTAAVTTGRTHYAFSAESNISTGGGTTWNFYASGTAPNYFAGVSQFADGAAATPSITNIGNTNTGIFFPATDTIAFAEGGVESMRLDASGNVGIGTSSIAGIFGKTLQVGDGTTAASISLLGTGAVTTGDVFLTSAASTASLIARGSTDLILGSNDLERVRISSNGNVGIGGTANTAAILDVQSTTKGFLPPRMTTTQRNAITSPPPGLVIFNTTTSREEGYDGAQWIPRIPLDETEDYIINGGFDVWQRGTTTTVNGYGAADRWVNGFVGGTVTQSRQSFTAGEVLGNNNPTFFLRQNVTGQTLTSHYASTVQRIEGVRTYAGQTITVLGWAKRATAGNIALSVEQYFGTGGTPSADVNSSGQTLALSTTWTPFAITFTVPSITGKTLGTNNNDFLQISFWSSAGTDFNARTNSLGLQTTDVDLWGIHIREGVYTANDALMYRQKDLQSEIDKCYRYYYRVTTPAANHVFAPGYNTATTTTRNMIQFPARMRAAPTALEQTGVAGNYLVFNAATTTACTAVPVFVTATELNAQISGTTGATLVAGQGSILGSNAAGAYLAWSAEL
jgi:hypothetical protein